MDNDRFIPAQGLNLNIDTDKFNKSIQSTIRNIDGIQKILEDTEKEQMRTIKAVEQEKMRKEALEEKRHNELLSVGKEQVKQLETVNEQLENKLNSANRTLDFILNSMGANFQRIERHQILQNEKLAELIAIVSAKDENKLKKFIEEHGMESIGLILQVVSFFTGKG